MNAERRKRIQKLAAELERIKAEIEECASDEREYFDNMPESLQNGDRGQASEAAADNLDEAEQAIEDATNYLNEAAS